MEITKTNPTTGTFKGTFEINSVDYFDVLINEFNIDFYSTAKGAWVFAKNGN